MSSDGGRPRLFEYHVLIKPTEDSIPIKIKNTCQTFEIKGLQGQTVKGKNSLVDALSIGNHIDPFAKYCGVQPISLSEFIHQKLDINK